MLQDAEKKHWETTEHSGQLKRKATHPVVEFYCKQRINYIKNFLNLDSIKTALDVGAGTGFGSYYFPKSIDMTDLDFSFRLLLLNPIQNKIQSSAYDLPFASNSFELVFGWNVLHHLDNPEIAVSEMARVTKKYLVLFEPNKNNPVQYMFGLTQKHERGTLKFSKDKLLGLLDKIKFKLIECNSVGWFFAGPTPSFCLPILRKLPFVHALGVSSVLICEKQ